MMVSHNLVQAGDEARPGYSDPVLLTVGSVRAATRGEDTGAREEKGTWHEY
jgi:hypothetical protein